ncbi:urease accessory protein UreF [Agrocybe pediades]|nr:urease accessory protein UreF [Agrocybe pediades]
MSDNESDLETYILLLLSDSNLPTGSFVASSGLESYVKHGFASSSPTDVATVDFLRDSLASYARGALPFVSEAHKMVMKYGLAEDGKVQEAGKDEGLDSVLEALSELDALYQAMTLNHVARRASMSQGVALLTLYSKGFSRPPFLSMHSGAESCERESRMRILLDRFKLRVRKEEVHGHLPVCWGILTAALGLSLQRTQYLHLFLHARSLLSASVRLNDLGPYGAQQILLHAVRPLVATEAERSRDLQTGMFEKQDFDEITQGPANTWPLGEILAGRHDLQHSRIFNS